MDGKINTAVMLVGGEALRLRPFTNNTPKALIEICGKPILDWALNWLKKYDIQNVVLGVAYKKEKIIEYVKKKDFGLNVTFSEHTVEGGTGEGFRLAVQRYVNASNFIAMNGDELTNLNLKKLMEFHLETKPVATIAISPLKSPYGIVDLYDDSIIGFREKPILNDKFVSTGIYVFHHKIKQYLPEKGSIESITFPILAQKGLIKAYKLRTDERWFTVNTVKDLNGAQEELKLMGWVE